MRLFVGFFFPKNVKDCLYKIQTSFDRSSAKVNWVHKNKLHSTFKFLGEVDESKIEEISERLKKVKFSSIAGTLADLDSFSHKDKIKVLWVGLQPREEIIKLQQNIDSELMSLFPGGQKFIPHLTLGKVKLVKNKEKFEKEMGAIRIGPEKFKINGFHLAQSILSKDGAKYKILETFEPSDL